MQIESSLKDAGKNTTMLKHEIAPVWVASPDFRGTGDVLWSCLVTLTACVYTALHLNIPSKHRSQWRRVGAKIKWVLIALLGPEIVLVTAIDQFRRATRLCKALNSMSSQQLDDTEDADPVEPPSRKNKAGYHQPPSDQYDLSYGFFAAMGGFVVDVSDIHEKLDLIPLNTTGVEFLARQGHRLRMSKEQIADKSKGNYLAKSVVCFQVSWMFVQCIVRTAAGYPLALLELHTMVHTICALCNYICWWKKPLDIEEPEIIEASGFRDLIAFMLVHSVPPFIDEWDSYGFDPEAHNMLMYLSNGDSNSNPAERIRVDLSTRIAEWATGPRVVSGQSPRSTLMPDVYESASLKEGEVLECGLGPSRGTVKLTSKDVKRWTLAAEAIDKLNTKELVDLLGPKNFESAVSVEGCKGVTPDASNLPAVWILADRNKIHTYINIFLPIYQDYGLSSPGAMLLPMIFGGVHLTAWNYNFASRTERILWRASGIGIMANYLIVEIFIRGFWLAPVDLLWILFFAINFAYILCRMYLVVESFISLRHAAIGIYAAVPWVQSIPHI